MAGDNGAVEQVRLSFSDDSPGSSFFYLERILSVQEHDDLITGLAITPDRSKIITTSYDRSIVVLDRDNFKLITRVSEAHADLISHAAINDGNMLCTAGNDGAVLTWDMRTMLDANSSLSCIYEDLSVRPTCVKFAPKQEHQVVVGNQAGQIQLFDIRKPKEALCEAIVDHKPITRINFQEAIFSVCSESSSLKVFEINEASTNIELT